LRKIYYLAFMFVLIFSIINAFETVVAQFSSPINSSSNIGAKVQSTLPLSLPSSPATVAPLNSKQHLTISEIKSEIFSDIAKCISNRTCHPIMGSEGNDRITGGNGSAILIGLGGNDIIRGGTGDNIIIAGGGDNQLYGGGGSNIIIASGNGIDQIYGGNKSNIILGGQGSSLIVAGKGNDKLYGGGGNDIFIGGQGANYFVCGAGGSSSSSGSGGTGGSGSSGASNSVVINFNATKGDDTDGNCGTILGQ
jgi:hemolysin type calcium-binding protein